MNEKDAMDLVNEKVSSIPKEEIKAIGQEIDIAEDIVQRHLSTAIDHSLVAMEAADVSRLVGVLELAHHSTQMGMVCLHHALDSLDEEMDQEVALAAFSGKLSDNPYLKITMEKK